MNDYKVSICVPIYGVEKYIERCARSLFEQTYNNIEYIFINDATIDNSIVLLNEVINDFKAKSLNIKIINHKYNRGLAAARNTSVAVSSGEFILHVDSDDYLEKNAVELLVAKQKETNADIVSADAIAYYPKYKERITHLRFTSSKQMAISILSGNAKSYIWGRLIKRTLYIDNNIAVKEGLNMGEDLQVSAVLAYHARHVTNLTFPVYHYECNNMNAYTSSYSRDKIRQNDESFFILCDFFKDKGPDYVRAINISNIRRIVERIITISKTNDNVYFNELLSKKKELPTEYWKYVYTPKRVVLYINNKCLVHAYVSTVGWIKHFVQQILSMFK